MVIESNTRRLGLALSGGGFRASFYHIGVLARMAEHGMLKHVESISTVSGGTIVGVAYYLLLKDLLESKADENIVDDDYVKLVEKLEVHFLTAVQKNLRMLTFANPIDNIKMSLDPLRTMFGMPHYSRSDTLGELYEEYIYKPLVDVGDRRIHMSDLLISPQGCGDDFHPWHEELGNRVRKNKVPVLILNATSLNTGHNWYFTASSMGEVPPRNLNFRDIDKKDRYRRVRYDEITTRKPFFKLGAAVAASAGVPGLFPPMAVSKLYQDRRVQLVDGGVYDNQGIAGLLDPDFPCSHFVVSDASGQSVANDNPDPNLIPVLINCSGILGGRVREEMVNSLEETHESRVAYFHLTRGMLARDIEFNEGGISSEAGEKMKKDIIACDQEFDVTQDAQYALAHIRTDLDSFTDVEAGCLQADAYQMSQSRLLKLKAFVSDITLSGNWQFNRYRPLLKNGDKQTLQQLELGRHQFLKPYIFLFNGACGFLKSIGLIAVSLPLFASLAAIVFAVYWVLKTYLQFDLIAFVTDTQVFTAEVSEAASDIHTGIGALLCVFVLSKIADKLISGSGKWTGRVQKLLKAPMSVLSSIALKMLAPVLFALPIWIYVYTVDKYFIKILGKLD